MATKEATAVALEEEAARLKEELQIVEEAKSTGEAFAQQKDEPFSTSHPEPNEWHKNSGGGCIIL